MDKICVFAGTTEGREVIEFLSAQGVQTTACVATEYGQALLPEAENLTISAKRLPVAEIEAMLQAERFALVIDATHPYAASITGSISRACAATQTEYLRLLRGASSAVAEAVYVQSAEEAAEFLRTEAGNILLTTGSKELGSFAGLPDFSARVYARVLPMEASLVVCREAGVQVSHIFAMQGPFSEEMNVAQLRTAKADWLVTKDGGDAGGFAAKIAAAEKLGVRVLVIGRPAQREGLGLSETIGLLCERFGLRQTPKVAVVGIGPGSRETMTAQARRALERADCLIGAKRMLQAVAAAGQACVDAIAPEQIAEFIRSHGQYRRFAVVLSGDVGFFSGAKKLLPLLDGCEVEVLPGISSLVYLCARLGTAYDDVTVKSLHGRDGSIVPTVRAARRVFALVGGADGMQRLCRELEEAGLGGVKVSVGERLSYPDEQIRVGTAAELAGEEFAALSVALIEHEMPDEIVTPGLPDEAFLRGSGERGIVPMTKSEVRAVCLAKLRLTEGAVCWDIGAGTGSVAIEMARQVKDGAVYGVECRPEAVTLMKENRARLFAQNLHVVSGVAPEACRALPAPGYAFIGGSSGNVRQIIALLLEKNPAVRIVATAVSLETVAELTACMREFAFSETEVVCLQIARDKKAGAYRLMTGQNPVYIFTMQGGGDGR